MAIKKGYVLPSAFLSYIQSHCQIICVYCCKH